MSKLIDGINKAEIQNIRLSKNIKSLLEKNSTLVKEIIKILDRKTDQPIKAGNKC